METPSKKGAQKRRGLAGTGTKEVIRFSVSTLLENVWPVGEKASGSEGSFIKSS